MWTPPLAGTRWAPPSGTERSVFFFFSNRLGCLGSLALSLGLTIVLLWALSR
jgi:hypothetical protein